MHNHEKELLRALVLYECRLVSAQSRASVLLEGFGEVSRSGVTRVRRVVSSGLPLP